jgi:hypothetical protein
VVIHINRDNWKCVFPCPMHTSFLYAFLVIPVAREGEERNLQKEQAHQMDQTNLPTSHGHYSNEEYRALNANQWMKLMQHCEQQEDPPG